MAVFRLRFHQCDGTVSDMDDGVEARDLADARRLAVVHARDIMAREIRQGRLCLSCWIVISDAHGNNLLTLQFGEAIAFTGTDACDHETEEAARSSA